MLRISNIKMPIPSTEEDLKRKVFDLLGTRDIKNIEISKKAIDARKKSNVFFVYSVDVDVNNEQSFLEKNKNISIVEKKEYSFNSEIKLSKRPVIIGSGPAGLFAALVLAQNGIKPIVLERGADVKNREKAVSLFWKNGKMDTETNVQFGEGGAGTFSDGKLTTGIKDYRITKVLDEFVKHGAPKEIKYLSKPHIGTDILKNVVCGIRNEIINLGGEVRFLSRADGIETRDGKVTGVWVTSEKEKYLLPTEKVIIAAGHSARDTFKMLFDLGVEMEQKPFSLGVRIEHLQSDINREQYGLFSRYLGAADYKLSVKNDDGRGVYTFCMCPGGFVVNASSEENMIATNGMSNFARNEKNANSAVLVSVNTSDFPSNSPLAGLQMQREIERKAYIAAGENYRVPVQTVGGFLKDEKDEKIGKVSPTVLPGYEFCKMSDILPDFVTKALKEALPKFSKKLKGFADGEAIMTAPETRSSSPVRIIRNGMHETNISGLYSAGEGGGHAGGIISSAVDGIKTAEMLVKKE